MCVCVCVCVCACIGYLACKEYVPYYIIIAYANVNILGGSVDSVKKNAEALVAATKEIGLKINAHKTKYITVSRDQNTVRIHSMKTDNSSIERVEEFKYLGTVLTNQNSIQEEIKSRLKLGNAYYYSV